MKFYCTIIGCEIPVIVVEQHVKPKNGKNMAKSLKTKMVRDGAWTVSVYQSEQFSVASEEHKIYVTNEGLFCVEFDHTSTVYQFLKLIGKCQDKSFSTMAAIDHIQTRPLAEDFRKALKILISNIHGYDGLSDYNKSDFQSWESLNVEVLELL